MKNAVLRVILAAAVVYVTGAIRFSPDGPGPMPMCMPGTPCPNAPMGNPQLSELQ